MIEVIIHRKKDGCIDAFTVTGHAGYAEAGRDIICAAVSAICYTAVGYFHTVRPEDGDSGFRERSGFMQFRVPEQTEERDAQCAQAVLEAMEIGLRQVRESYGGRYIRIRTEKAD